MAYGWLVLLHILGVLAFFSNAVASLFWRSRAERSRDPRLLAFAYRGLMAADAWITTPSVVAILVGGIGAARVAGLPLSTRWILGSAVCFALSGLVFAVCVLPVQARLASAAERAAAEGAFDAVAHGRDSRAWAAWAHLSLAAALAAVLLMVLRW